MSSPSRPPLVLVHGAASSAGVWTHWRDEHERQGFTVLAPDLRGHGARADLEERRIALASLARESRLARDERRAGIVIESLPGPMLIVTGTAAAQWPRERYASFALPAEHLSADGASTGASC